MDIETAYASVKNDRPHLLDEQARQWQGMSQALAAQARELRSNIDSVDAAVTSASGRAYVDNLKRRHQRLLDASSVARTNAASWSGVAETVRDTQKAIASAHADWQKTKATAVGDEETARAPYDEIAAFTMTAAADTALAHSANMKPPDTYVPLPDVGGDSTDGSTTADGGSGGAGGSGASGGTAPTPPHSGGDGSAPTPPHSGGHAAVPPHSGGTAPTPPDPGGHTPVPPHPGVDGHNPALQGPSAPPTTVPPSPATPTAPPSGGGTAPPAMVPPPPTPSPTPAPPPASPGPIRPTPAIPRPVTPPPAPRPRPAVGPRPPQSTVRPVIGSRPGASGMAPRGPRPSANGLNRPVIGGRSAPAGEPTPPRSLIGRNGVVSNPKAPRPIRATRAQFGGRGTNRSVVSGVRQAFEPTETAPTSATSKAARKRDRETTPLPHEGGDYTWTVDRATVRGVVRAPKPDGYDADDW